MKILYKRNQLSDNIMSNVFRYGSWVLGLNLLTLVLIVYGLHISGTEVYVFDSFPFVIKYVVIELVFAWIMPYIVESVRKYLSIAFEVEDKKSHEDKKDNQ